MTEKKETLKQIIEQECTKHIKDARSQIRRLLKDSMLSLIGLSKKWDGSGRMEIDHCNGRNSLLIDAFRECAIEEAKKIARNFKPTSESIVQYTQTFQVEFDCHLRRQITELAKQKAKEEAKKVVNAIKIDVDAVINQM